MLLATEHFCIVQNNIHYRLYIDIIDYHTGKNINYDNLRLAYQTVEEIVHGPGSSGEYQTVWHTMEMEGIRIPRKLVQMFLKEIDPA